jgi:hypothetical protein
MLILRPFQQNFLKNSSLTICSQLFTVRLMLVLWRTLVLNVQLLTPVSVEMFAIFESANHITRTALSYSFLQIVCRKLSLVE